MYRRSIVVTPAAEGLLFVTLSVRLKHDEMTDMKVFAVPVIVGAAQPRTRGRRHAKEMNQRTIEL